MKIDAAPSVSLLILLRELQEIKDVGILEAVARKIRLRGIVNLSDF